MGSSCLLQVFSANLPTGAAGGASQDNAGEGGGTAQTPVLSGEGDGPGTALCCSSSNSPLVLPTPVRSRKGLGQTEGSHRIIKVGKDL